MLVKVGRYASNGGPRIAFRIHFASRPRARRLSRKGQLLALQQEVKLFYGCDKFPKHKFAMNYRP